jgi:ParB/RepB/Spo0J family partition protein
MNQKAQAMDVDIVNEVYIDPEINNRELADTPDETQSLANSIETTGGLLQPIVVYVTPDARKTEHGMPYELGSGYRRCAALKYLAERNEDETWTAAVPAMVHERTEIADRHVHQLVENLQRKDLAPMEIALAFKRAIDDKSANLNQTELARKIAWPVPTVSNYLRVANNLTPEVQGMVLEGKVGFSQAKELASVVQRHHISDKEQLELAAVASGQQHAEFVEHLQNHYREEGEEGATAEGATAANGKEVSSGKEGSQRTYNTIRGSVLETKYIPKLEEMVKQATTEEQKVKYNHYMDAIKFVLNVDGTELGTELAPWEQKLQEEKEALKEKEDRDRNESQYIRKAVSAIKKELKNIPPATLPDGTPNPKREAPTLPTVLEQTKKAIEESLKKAHEAGLEQNQMIEGFMVSNVDEFIEKISNSYVESVKKDNEATARRAAAAEKKKLAEKEAAEKGSDATETAAV